jgi:hypothetical protein
VESRLSLDALADSLADGRLDPSGIFATAGRGLRIVSARTPGREDGDEAAVIRLLADGRAAHALTVLDCGTLASRTSRVAAAQASHVVVVAPATTAGVRRAECTLAAWPSWSAADAVLVARADSSGNRASMRQLTRLAQRFGGPLLLMPEVGDLADRDPASAVEACQVTLQAVATLLRR